MSCLLVLKLPNGIVSAFRPRMTTENSSQSQNRSSDYTIAVDCLIRILAARRLESACAVYQPQRFKKSRIGGQVFLIKPYSEKNVPFHEYAPRMNCFSARRSRTSGKTASSRSGNTDRTTNTPDMCSFTRGSICCIASRINRFMRFRFAARLSTFAETTTANRDCIWCF